MSCLATSERARNGFSFAHWLLPLTLPLLVFVTHTRTHIHATHTHAGSSDLTLQGSLPVLRRLSPVSAYPILLFPAHSVYPVARERQPQLTEVSSSSLAALATGIIIISAFFIPLILSFLLSLSLLQEPRPSILSDSRARYRDCTRLPRDSRLATHARTSEGG